MAFTLSDFYQGANYTQY